MTKTKQTKQKIYIKNIVIIALIIAIVAFLNFSFIENTSFANSDFSNISVTPNIFDEKSYLEKMRTYNSSRWEESEYTFAIDASYLNYVDILGFYDFSSWEILPKNLSFACTVSLASDKLINGRFRFVYSDDTYTDSEILQHGITSTINFSSIPEKPIKKIILMYGSGGLEKVIFEKNSLMIYSTIYNNVRLPYIPYDSGYKNGYDTAFENIKNGGVLFWNANGENYVINEVNYSKYRNKIGTTISKTYDENNNFIGYMICDYLNNDFLYSDFIDSILYYDFSYYLNNESNLYYTFSHSNLLIGSPLQSSFDSTNFYENGKQYGYELGIKEGFEQGQIYANQNNDNNGLNIGLSTVKELFNGMAGLLNTKVFGSVPLGAFFGIPLLFSLIFFILKIVRG